MIFGSVCPGIEAASVAWEPLGWRPAFFSEIEPFPRAVLAARFPEVPLHGDFTTIQAGEYRPIDLLVGGTPCQDFSLAGLRKGLDGDRGNLTLEFLRLAGRLGPRWLVWENVPGVLSSNNGRDFGAFLGGLVELGYGFAYRVLDAQHFGVPQRRRRVFLVGYLGDWRPAAAVLFERACLRRDPAPGRGPKEDLAGTLAGGARNSGGYGTDDLPLTVGSLDSASGGADENDAEQGRLVAYGGNRQSGPIDVATAVTAHGGPHGRLDFETGTFVAAIAPALSSSNPYGDHEGREGLLVAHTLRAEGFDASEDGTGRGIPLLPIGFNSREDPSVSGDVAGALGSSSPQAQAVVFGIGSDAVDRSGEGGGGSARERSGLNIVEDLQPALRARPNNSVAAASKVRRLTPRECERLQGFPDDWTLITYRGKPAADGPRYKALGNSKAIPVVRWVGRRIAAVDAILRGEAAPSSPLSEVA